MNNFNKLKGIIIIIFILIILVIGMIILFKKKSVYKDDVIYQNVVTEKVSEKNDNGFQELKDPNIFFSVLNSFDNYVNILKYEISDNYEIEENPYQIESENDRNKILYLMLDENYINKNNITIENMSNYLGTEDRILDYIPTEMKVKYNNKTQTYILKVYIKDETDSLKEKMYIIRVDNSNSAFSIEPVNEQYEEINEVKVENEVSIIESNDYNKYNIESISIERIVKMYMDKYIEIAINYPELTYNNYLDDNYKKERFGSLEKFKKYIEDNKNELQNVRATKYLIENEDGITKYVCLDQYQNTYEFDEKSTMMFTVKLDTYTIMTDKFKNTYNSSTSNKKVMMNIDKWIEMLNNRDYSAAYNLLDKTFRNEKFGSEENFEQYMREKYPLHYKVGYGQFSDENGTFVQEIVLTDITEEDKSEIQNSIIMQLKENQDFVMSFGVE